jgi:uncharacterized membrane protein
MQRNYNRQPPPLLNLLQVVVASISRGESIPGTQSHTAYKTYASWCALVHSIVCIIKAFVLQLTICILIVKNLYQLCADLL